MITASVVRERVSCADESSIRSGARTRLVPGTPITATTPNASGRLAAMPAGQPRALRVYSQP
ncbi:hypothetical protein WS83_21975 [Burkholderia sp. MSMB2042]|uniref:Uncharacterized protein n=1 Tax=Burkholderia savannae TaxID=1637837 RepID=A0ABR5THY9_9BURK|nr:hypothetical protein WS78_15580 [Burkholderia savannae]KVG43973.1 hypothetical protein WS77_10510 [Burkholderia sp. MSMB0265]KVG83873.1 hypothetical protein WS81_07395 [Burkholderia sp. MSMB2040]KVG94907.1 hypothetical protein WS82_05900 [Burkholderia sp. MSMB2041]KVH00623.1 hypothetical protein WS83_21975 [Burkholderia sp. MSMB2042]KVK81104.1 hypothetical protein WS91_11230 [Burkholderia sp. MSMB1498]